MEDIKIELLEKLIKENKISLKEALVLIGGNEEKVVTQRIPSQHLPDSHWKKPYEIYSKRDPFTTTSGTTDVHSKRTTVTNTI